MNHVTILIRPHHRTFHTHALLEIFHEPASVLILGRLLYTDLLHDIDIQRRRSLRPTMCLNQLTPRVGWLTVQGPVSIPDETAYWNISGSLEVARLVFIIVRSL